MGFKVLDEYLDEKVYIYLFSMFPDHDSFEN